MEGGQGAEGVLRGVEKPGSSGAGQQQHPMIRDARIPDHWADMNFQEIRGRRVRNPLAQASGGVPNLDGRNRKSSFKGFLFYLRRIATKNLGNYLR